MPAPRPSPVNPKPPAVLSANPGDLRLKVMTFEKRGDVLAMHNHTHADVHITVVARGMVEVQGPTIDVATYSAGAVIDFNEGHPHEITALEDNSRIVNIVKHFPK